MAKKHIGTLTLFFRDTVVATTGTLVSQTEDVITLEVQRPRSSKKDTLSFPKADAETIIVGDQVFLYQRTVSEEDWPNVEMNVESSVGGYFVGAGDGLTFMCKPGTWKFQHAEAEEGGKKGGKKTEAAAPTKGKKAEVAEADSADAESEAEAEPFWPEDGANVKFKYDDEEVTGEVSDVTATSFKIDGTKYLKKKISDLEAVEAEAEPEPFWPEDGANVKFNYAGDEVTGEVSDVTETSFKIDGTKYLKKKIEDLEAVEAEAEEDYEPEVDDVVTVKFEDEDEEDVTGSVTAVNAKSISVDGTKYPRNTIKSIVKATSDGDAADDYEPEVGDYVNVNDGDDDHEGEVTKLTATVIKVMVDDEEKSFKRADVTVTEAEKPEPKGKGKAAPAAKGGKEGIKDASAKGGKAAAKKDDEGGW